ncbi:MAG: aquaporin [Gemmatimonadota bacterium]|nr:aquaporin [Gemmatimonadota bacterium]
MTEQRIQTLGRRATVEGVATFFFVLIGTGTIVVDARTGGEVGLVGIALAFGLALTGMVYGIRHLSGGHLNPAVTIGLWAVRRFPARDAVAYVAAQCFGAVAASLAVWTLLGAPEVVGQTVPEIGIGEAFAVEWLITFAFVFVVSAVASDERVAYGSAGLAIGFAYAFGVLFAGLLTGGAMNPARSLGPAVAGNVWEAHWIYWLAPIFGAIAGAWTYETLRAARSPDLSLKRERLFTVEGPTGVAPLRGPREPRRRSGVDRRKKDVGPPPGMKDRRSGGDRRDEKP